MTKFQDFSDYNFTAWSKFMKLVASSIVMVEDISINQSELIVDNMFPPQPQLVDITKVTPILR